MEVEGVRGNTSVGPEADMAAAAPPPLAMLHATPTHFLFECGLCHLEAEVGAAGPNPAPASVPIVADTVLDLPYEPFERPYVPKKFFFFSSGVSFARHLRRHRGHKYSVAVAENAMQSARNAAERKGILLPNTSPKPLGNAKNADLPAPMPYLPLVSDAIPCPYIHEEERPGGLRGPCQYACPPKKWARSLKTHFKDIHNEDLDDYLPLAPGQRRTLKNLGMCHAQPGPSSKASSAMWRVATPPMQPRKRHHGQEGEAVDRHLGRRRLSLDVQSPFQTAIPSAASILAAAVGTPGDTKWIDGLRYLYDVKHVEEREGIASLDRLAGQFETANRQTQRLRGQHELLSRLGLLQRLAMADAVQRKEAFVTILAALSTFRPSIVSRERSWVEPGNPRSRELGLRKLVSSVDDPISDFEDIVTHIFRLAGEAGVHAQHASAVIRLEQESASWNTEEKHHRRSGSFPQINLSFDQRQRRQLATALFQFFIGLIRSQLPGPSGSGGLEYAAIRQRRNGLNSDKERKTELCFAVLSWLAWFIACGDDDKCDATTLSSFVRFYTAAATFSIADEEADRGHASVLSTLDGVAGCYLKLQKPSAIYQSLSSLLRILQTVTSSFVSTLAGLRAKKMMNAMQQRDPFFAAAVETLGKKPSAISGKGFMSEIATLVNNVKQFANADALELRKKVVTTVDGADVNFADAHITVIVQNCVVGVNAKMIGDGWAATVSKACEDISFMASMFRSSSTFPSVADFLISACNGCRETLEIARNDPSWLFRNDTTLRCMYSETSAADGRLGATLQASGPNDEQCLSLFHVRQRACSINPSVLDVTAILKAMDTLVRRVAALLYVGAVSIRISELGTLALYGTDDDLVVAAVSCCAAFPRSLRIRVQSHKGKHAYDTLSGRATFRVLDPISSSVLFSYMVLLNTAYTLRFRLQDNQRSSSLASKLQGTALFPTFEHAETFFSPIHRASTMPLGDTGLPGRAGTRSASSLRRSVMPQLFACHAPLLHGMNVSTFRQIVAHLITVVLKSYPTLRLPAIALTKWMGHSVATHVQSYNHGVDVPKRDAMEWTIMAAEADNVSPALVMELWTTILLHGHTGVAAMASRLSGVRGTICSTPPSHRSGISKFGLLQNIVNMSLKRLEVTAAECLDAMRTVLGHSEAEFRSAQQRDACIRLANAGWSENNRTMAWGLSTGSGKTTTFFAAVLARARSSAAWSRTIMSVTESVAETFGRNVSESLLRFFHGILATQTAIFVSPFTALLCDVEARFSNVPGIRTARFPPAATSDQLADVMDDDKSHYSTFTVYLCTANELGDCGSVNDANSIASRSSIVFFDECHVYVDSLGYRRDLGANIRLRGLQSVLAETEPTRRLGACVGISTVEGLSDDARRVFERPLTPNIVLSSATMPEGTFEYARSILTGVGVLSGVNLQAFRDAQAPALTYYDELGVTLRGRNAGLPMCLTMIVQAVNQSLSNNAKACESRVALVRKIAKATSAGNQNPLVLFLCPTKRIVRELYRHLSAAENRKVKMHDGTAGMQDTAALVRSMKVQLESPLLVVATSALMCGIDIPAIDGVIFVGMPYDLSSLIQGIGRTGRNGCPGRSLLLVNNILDATGDDGHVQRIMNTLNIKVVRAADDDGGSLGWKVDPNHAEASNEAAHRILYTILRMWSRAGLHDWVKQGRNRSVCAWKMIRAPFSIENDSLQTELCTPGGCCRCEQPLPSMPQPVRNRGPVMTEERVAQTAKSASTDLADIVSNGRRTTLAPYMHQAGTVCLWCLLFDDKYRGCSNVDGVMCPTKCVNNQEAYIRMVIPDHLACFTCLRIGLCKKTDTTTKENCKSARDCIPRLLRAAAENSNLPIWDWASRLYGLEKEALVAQAGATTIDRWNWIWSNVQIDVYSTAGLCNFQMLCLAALRKARKKLRK